MADSEQVGTERQTFSTELHPGDIVVPDDPQPPFEVHAVEHLQGRVQVIDTDNLPHVYTEDELVEVRPN